MKRKKLSLLGSMIVSALFLGLTLTSVALNAVGYVSIVMPLVTLLLFLLFAGLALFSPLEF